MDANSLGKGKRSVLEPRIDANYPPAPVCHLKLMVARAILDNDSLANFNGQRKNFDHRGRGGTEKLLAGNA